MSFVPLFEHHVQMDLIDMRAHSKCWFKEPIGEKETCSWKDRENVFRERVQYAYIFVVLHLFLFLFNKHLLLPVSQ